MKKLLLIAAALVAFTSNAHAIQWREINEAGNIAALEKVCEEAWPGKFVITRSAKAFVAKRFKADRAAFRDSYYGFVAMYRAESNNFPEGFVYDYCGGLMDIAAPNAKVFLVWFDGPVFIKRDLPVE